MSSPNTIKVNDERDRQLLMKCINMAFDYSTDSQKKELSRVVERFVIDIRSILYEIEDLTPEQDKEIDDWNVLWAERSIK